MVVEDCKLTLEMTKFILIKLGVEKIFTASNANEFEKLIAEYVTPDLIITDWNIDKGFKGCDVISAMEKLDKPIAVVSSENKRKLSSEKHHWFKKPLKSQELLAWFKELYA